jgi:hypothetical protein
MAQPRAWLRAAVSEALRLPPHQIQTAIKICVFFLGPGIHHFIDWFDVCAVRRDTVEPADAVANVRAASEADQAACSAMQ